MSKIKDRLGTIAVTGGCGFIGRHVIRKLMESGYRTIVIDKEIPHECQIKDPGISYVKCDLLNKQTLEEIFGIYEPVAVIHLAGLPHIPTCESNPDLSYYINTVTTHNVLETMRKYNVLTIVFASTGAIYGVPSDKSINEDSNPHPRGIYGWHKYESEIEIRAYSERYEINGIVLRLFNVYGNDPNKGKDVVSIFTRNIINGKEIIIKGPNKFRDFIYVEDVADAFVKALEINVSGYITINIGTGVKTTLLELANSLEELLGKTAKKKIIKDPEDGLGYYANINRMIKYLGIQPKTLKDGLKRYLKEYNLI